MRSRWLGSKLACILNTKPVSAFSLALTSLSIAGRFLGLGAMSKKVSNNS
jgi:hypothetical protein